MQIIIAKSTLFCTRFYCEVFVNMQQNTGIVSENSGFSDSPKLTNKSDLFWDLIQVKMQCEVPIYLRNLLHLNGFSNVVSVKEMDDEDITELENFVKTEKLKSLLPERYNPTDYFGQYADASSFEIPRGTRKMLKEISRYASEKWNSEGAAFFDPLDISNKMVLKTLDCSSRLGNINLDRNSKGNNFTSNRNQVNQLKTVHFSIAKRSSLHNEHH